MSGLPQESFAALAFELRLRARWDTSTVERAEEFIARLGDEASIALKQTLRDLQASNARLCEAAAVMERLSDKEAAVRALIDGDRIADHMERRLG